ncbi:hypothetical protein [Spirillospora sp. CA-294931]|uniref:hypothetical protein n=1 Tax=Spirillospora sp. CA-294931 TaxID=3240042 RepID=UPI003D93336A
MTDIAQNDSQISTAPATRYTEEELREFARQVIESKTEDPDFIGVAEQFEEEWADLDEAALDEVHRKVYDLACAASVTVFWPDDQTGEARG